MSDTCVCEKNQCGGDLVRGTRGEDDENDENDENEEEERKEKGKENV